MDNILDRWKELKNVFSASCYYVLFSLIFFLTLLILTSFVSFFHFTLGHDFNTIEIWISNNIWEMVAVANISSFFVFYKIFLTQNLRFSISRNYFDRPFDIPRPSLYIVISYLLVMVCVLSRPAFNEEVSYYYSALSMIYHFILYACGFFVHTVSLRHSSIKTIWGKYLFFILATSLFILNLKLSSPGIKIYKGLYGLQYFFLLWLYSMRNSWPSSLVFLCLCIIPTNVFFGYDVFFSNEYSLFITAENMRFDHLLLVYSIAFFYLYHKSRSNYSVSSS